VYFTGREDRDDEAFEELVRRHGPLVWSVCRQLLWHNADAEDAFQAVFLALVQGAPAIRSGQALPAWLHGVAVRVAEKAKRAAGRRRERETRAAVPEFDQPVPNSTWAAMMSAVHEEVQLLPEAEREVFILCELEGLPQPDAAGRLGCALGTVSGRLCRARQRLIARLSRRGIVPSLLAVGGLAGSTGGAPAALIARVSSFPSTLTDGVSSTVAALAHGLAGGASMRLKLFATTLLILGAVGVTGGSLFLASAEGQFGGGAVTATPAGGQRSGVVNPAGQTPPAAGTPSAAPGAPSRQQADPFSGIAPAAPPGRNAPEDPAAGGFRFAVGAGGSSTWEYKFVDLKNEDKKAFEKEIVDAGSQGWEFAGSERLAEKQNPVLVLVFKKRKGGDNAFFGAFGGPQGGGFGGAGGGFGMPGQGGGFGGPGGGFGGAGGGFGVPGQGGGRGSAPRPPEPPAAPGAPGMPPMMGAAGPGMAQAGIAPAGMPGVQRNTSAKTTSDLEVITLKHSDSSEIATVLMRVFANQNLELTPVPRTNQLIMRTNPETAKEVEKLLKQLDVPGPDPRSPFGAGGAPGPIGPGR
jgi:RNA polymerase sigma factor (sigma-70 family)